MSTTEKMRPTNCTVKPAEPPPAGSLTAPREAVTVSKSATHWGDDAALLWRPIMDRTTVLACQATATVAQ
jgi:hypothetical protein